MNLVGYFTDFTCTCKLMNFVITDFTCRYTCKLNESC